MNTLVLAIALTVSAHDPDTIVVCPPVFEHAIQPWLEYRRAQGHVIAVVSCRGTAAEIRSRIRAHATSGKLRFVLLIGDAAPPKRRPFYVSLLAASGAQEQPGGEANHCVPASYTPAKVTLRWGGEPLIATDDYYADLDGDLSPDLAIGRLTADSPEELTAMIEKIMAYERNRDIGRWRTRINFIAGTGGFGAIADKLIERVAGNIVARYLPATYKCWITYAQGPDDPSTDPETFRDKVIDRLNEGCAYWVYIGHGDERNLVSAPSKLSSRWHAVFSARDVRRLQPAGGPSIALFLACRTGAFDKRDDCLAEELLRAPAGPVAVIAGSRVTMPYAMTILGRAMIVETFVNRRATVGEVVLHAKRRLLPPADEHRVGLATLVAVSKSFETIPEGLIPITRRLAVLRFVRLFGALPADLMQERAEHVALFNIIGDPLLRLRHPSP
jgi:hypothetical protein